MNTENRLDRETPMEDLVKTVVEKLEAKYYGKYRGFVADNADPERRGRLRLTVPSLLGDQVTDWALPCLPYGGLAEQGLFTIPEAEAQVWVEFEEGELSRPIWTGVFWQQAVGDLAAFAADDKPVAWSFKTPFGHTLSFQEGEGQESIRLTHGQGAGIDIDAGGTITLASGEGTRITLDGEGQSITVQDGGGNTLTLGAAGATLEDSHGNRIELGAAGVKVEGQQIVIQGSEVVLGGEGGEPLIKGGSFLALFNAHVHATGVGPSGPPMPPLEASVLSTAVRAT